MSYQIKLPAFEGPMDLLLHLIKKEKIDIYDIPIAVLVEEYLNYLQTMQELDMEITSEFLVMAANLLAIKAKMLLPKPPRIAEEQAAETALDPRQELVANLLSYQKYRQLADLLQQRQESDWRCFEGGLAEEAKEKLCHDWLVSEQARQEILWQSDKASVDQLLQAFITVLQRKKTEENPQETSDLNDITQDEYQISDKIWEIKKLLFLSAGSISFNCLLGNCICRSEIVVTFMALLELIKEGCLVAIQEQQLGEIILFAGENSNAE